jgi:hypothetical protein
MGVFYVVLASGYVRVRTCKEARSSDPEYWYSNLGVREFALWQFTFSFAGRFFCRSCDSPHILPNLFVHYFFGLVANLMHVWISGDRTA